MAECNLNIKAKLLGITMVLYFFSIGLPGQILPANKKKQGKSAFLQEWKGGIGGALISAGGVLSGFLISGLIERAIPDNGSDEEMFGFGLLPVMFALSSVPVTVAWGVHRAGQAFNPEGEYWHAWVGSMVGVVVSIPVNSLIYKLANSYSDHWLVNLTPFILDPFVIIPFTAILSYNLLGRHKKHKDSTSLLNFKQGAFEMGSPIPRVYPNPYLHGKICSQVSLLRISL